MNGPYWVYVLRDTAGRVLYVGQTARPELRMSEHRIGPWGSEINRFEMISAADRDEARRMEAGLIGALTPAYNVQRPGPGRQPVAEFEGLTTAQVADRKGVRRRTVNRWVESGKLVPVQVLPGRTGAHLFDVEVVDAFDPTSTPTPSPVTDGAA